MITFSLRSIATQPQTSKSNTGWKIFTPKRRWTTSRNGCSLKTASRMEKQIMDRPSRWTIRPDRRVAYRGGRCEIYLPPQLTSDNQTLWSSRGSDDYLYNEDRSSDYRHLNHISAYPDIHWNIRISPSNRIALWTDCASGEIYRWTGENSFIRTSDLVPSVPLGNEAREDSKHACRL